MSKSPEKKVIPFGPYHPVLEEGELFELTVRGEVVEEIYWKTGYNHRSIETIAETKTYDQICFLVERICGICSHSHPYGFVRAVEDLAEVEIPERAVYIRTIVAELERLHSHLLWMGLAGHFIGYNTVFMWGWKYREPVLDILEEVTGNRQHYATLKIGGVRRDLEESKYEKILDMLDDVEEKCRMLLEAVPEDPVLKSRLQGVGVLTEQEARDWGTLGPTARGSGYDIDVRRDHPHAAYDWVDWDVCVEESGDVYAKTMVRLRENMESIKIIRQCIDQMVPGPIENEVREIPPGEGIGTYGAPRGETFHYVASDGTNSPIRHKVRAPSFNNVPSFEASCIGEEIADVLLTLAAVDPCYSCTERSLKLTPTSSDERLLTPRQLLEASRNKTKELIDQC